jgi:hypothetical protein
MTRIVLVALLLSALAGCVDYRGGSHWDGYESAAWQRNDKVFRFMGDEQLPGNQEWVSRQCREQPFHLSTLRTGDSLTHSLFFIPLIRAHGAERRAETVFYAKYPGVAAHCGAGNAPVITVLDEHGNGYADLKVSACKDADCCRIEVPVSPDALKTIKIRIDGKPLSCSIDQLVLTRKSHLCLRPTEFGGSDACQY